MMTASIATLATGAPAAIFLPPPGDGAMVPLTEAEMGAAFHAARADAGAVVSVRFEHSGKPGVLFLRDANGARQAAMAALMRHGTLKPDAELTIPPSQILTGAREGAALRQTVESYRSHLAAPLSNGHPPHPMMALRTMAARLLRIEATHLGRKAERVFPNRGKLVDETKILVLLNVLHNEDRDLLNRYFHFLDNPVSEIFFENLADVVVGCHRDAAKHLRGATRRDYQEILPMERAIHAFETLLRWARGLFPEVSGVFNRRLAELGFEETAILFQRMKMQVRLAKSTLRSLD